MHRGSDRTACEVTIFRSREMCYYWKTDRYGLEPGCKLEPVYPTNHGYISNLAGKKYNLPVTLTGKKIEANMRQNGLWGTIPTILVLNLMMTKSLLNQRRTNISFICT